jgi:hypothetical protein
MGGTVRTRRSVVALRRHVEARGKRAVLTELTELEWEAQLKRDLLARYERRYETDEWQYRAFDGGPRYIVP